jgi:ATP-binding cassette subfamily C (CFTR/MRP) protein 1
MPSEAFNASKLFVTLILISLLANPLIAILQLLPSFGAARACFSRLQEYLERPERVENRLDFSGRKVNAYEDVSFHNADSEKCFSLEKISGSMPTNDVSIISIRNANLGWSNVTQLASVNFEVARGEHVVITGPVGSGKSLILQAILGEVIPLSGFVYTGSGKIGYNGQTPWLENISALENVFRSLQVDDVWRHKIIEACALEEVINSQGPDDTIGTGGAKLSGGERQRLVRDLRYHIYSTRSFNWIRANLEGRP